MKRILICLLLSLPLAAQQTVVQQLFTGNTSGNVNSVAVQNVGQVGHIVYVQFANNNALTCSNPQGNASLQYSFDNVNWINFGLPILVNHSLTSLTQAFYGSGVFNYVRFHLDWSSTNSCKASAWYTGTTSFGPVSQATGALPVYSVIDDGIGNVIANPQFMGGIGTLQLTPLFTCDKTAQATITSGTEALIAKPDLAAASGRVVVCSMAVTMATTGTFQLVGDNSTCNGTPQNISPAWNLNAGVPLAMGSGTGMIVTTAGNQSLCGKATGGNASVMVSYLTW